MVPEAISRRLRDATGSILLLGVSRQLSASLAAALDIPVITADLAAPLFGPPGAVCRARRVGNAWSVSGIEALCTLDPARFRLPLLIAIERLFDSQSLVELPALTRGMAAAEILTSVAARVGAHHVVVGSPEVEASLGEEIAARGLTCSRGEPAASKDRARVRARLWDTYLEGAVEVGLDVGTLARIGAPPPLGEPTAWPGRQVALLDAEGATLVLGEAIHLDGAVLVVRAPALEASRARALLVRDARRDSRGILRTERAFSRGRQCLPSDLRLDERELREGPVLSLSSAKAVLVNGVFGDPLVHIRMRHEKRSLLFDLGDASRLPSRIVHQVSDVFVSHAHFDHIGGFLWFLRACLGSPKSRRIFGPEGLTEHLVGMVQGILWDRIGDRGPVFRVIEVGAARCTTHRMQVGKSPTKVVSEHPVEDDVLLDEPAFRVRFARLDHGVPVLAFAFEESRVFHVRKDVLVASGYAQGRWLSELKTCLHQGARESRIRLPDGRERTAGKLARELVVEGPGRKLCYATDLDDTAANRAAVVELARNADLLLLEASFVEEHRRLARATQHLTARACGEIARRARVRRVVPFHFSKRYEHDPQPVYDEVEAAFSASSAD